MYVMFIEIKSVERMVKLPSLRRSEEYMLHLSVDLACLQVETRSHCNELLARVRLVEKLIHIHRRFANKGRERHIPRYAHIYVILQALGNMLVGEVVAIIKDEILRHPYLEQVFYSSVRRKSRHRICNGVIRQCDGENRRIILRWLPRLLGLVVFVAGYQSQHRQDNKQCFLHIKSN